MALLRRSSRSSLAALILAAGAAAVEIPAGTEIPIRLTSKLSTQASKPGDAVEAVVIGGPLAGATLRGTVEKAAQSAKGDERSMLALRFTEIEAGAAKAKIDTRVAGVDN